MTEPLQKVIFYLRQDNFIAAHRELLVLIDNSNECIQYLPLKGYIELKLNRVKEAKATLKQSIKKKQTSDGWRYLAEVYAQEKCFNKAYNAFNISYSISKDIYVYRKIICFGIILKEYETINEFTNNEKIKEIVKRLRDYKREGRRNMKQVDGNLDTCTDVILNEDNLVYESSAQSHSESTLNDQMPILDPVNRCDLTQTVFRSVKNHQFVESLQLLQQSFGKNSIDETIDHIIYIEWIEYLFLLLTEFKSKNHCMLSLKIVNALKSIFLNYRANFIDCLFYLLENRIYERIEEAVIADIELHEIFYETECIKREIMERHGDFSLSKMNCECGEMETSLEIFNKLCGDMDYLNE